MNLGADMSLGLLLFYVPCIIAPVSDVVSCLWLSQDCFDCRDWSTLVLISVSGPLILSLAWSQIFIMVSPLPVLSTELAQQLSDHINQCTGAALLLFAVLLCCYC